MSKELQLTQQIHSEINRLKLIGKKIKDIESDYYWVKAWVGTGIMQIGYLQGSENCQILCKAFNPSNLRQLIMDVWGYSPWPKIEQGGIYYNYLLGFDGLYWTDKEKALKYLLNELKNI